MTGVQTCALPISELKIKLHHPRHVIHEKRQRLADLEDVLNRRFTGLIEEDRRKTESRKEWLSAVMNQRMEQDKKRLALISGKMWGLSPLKKLSQGYGFVTDRDGNRVESVKQTPPGCEIAVQVADGRLRARVEERQEVLAWQKNGI